MKINSLSYQLQCGSEGLSEQTQKHLETATVYQRFVMVFTTLVACKKQRFSISVPREVLKHATTDYLVKPTDLFFHRSQVKKKMTTAEDQTVAMLCE